MRPLLTAFRGDEQTLTMPSVSPDRHAARSVSSGVGYA